MATRKEVEGWYRERKESLLRDAKASDEEFRRELRSANQWEEVSIKSLREQRRKRFESDMSDLEEKYKEDLRNAR